MHMNHGTTRKERFEEELKAKPKLGRRRRRKQAKE